MYYFIGIKGAGMAALAVIMHKLGHEVSGSDIEKHLFTEEELQQYQIPVFPFNPNNIKDSMTVIIGNAFDESFPEVVATRNNPTIKAYRYHEFLGKLAENYQSFAIAGSHGKTTTTTMAANMFSFSTPTGYLIGDGSGDLAQDSTNFVIEACEYKRHFLAYYPDYAVITNIDLDHTDYFHSEEDYSLAYQEFIGNVKKGLALFGDDEKVRALKIDKTHLYYGENTGNDVQAINIIEYPESMEFDVLYKGELFGHFVLPFSGRFLLWNALSVITLGIFVDLSAEVINEGLNHFHGAKRRFVIEKVGESVFIDDYAHHPTEVSVTIDAARTRFPNHKIVAIFKPHRASRVYHFVDDFKKALMKADQVCLCPFSSIDDFTDGIEIEISYLADLIPNSRIVDENEEDAAFLASLAPACYLFMSSKDIYPLAEKVKKLL